MNLTTVLIVLLLVCLVGGGFGHGTYGAAGWSPAGLVLAVLLVLWLLGRL